MSEEHSITVTLDADQWKLLKSLSKEPERLVRQFIETFLLEQGDRNPPLSEDPT